MSDSPVITPQDIDLLDQCQHRLQCLRNYAVPNGTQYFGVPNQLDNALGSVATLLNRANDYLETSEGCLGISEDARQLILYFLRASDEHIATQGNAANVPQLAGQLQEYFERIGMTPVDTLAPDARAAQQLSYFITYYDPQPDAASFLPIRLQVGHVSGEVVHGNPDAKDVPIAVHFSTNPVWFDEARLHKIVAAERPELLVDFSRSWHAIVDKVRTISEEDAQIVQAVFMGASRTTEVEWGEHHSSNPSNKRFGINWGRDDAEWQKLSRSTTDYLDALWNKFKELTVRIRTAYDTPEEMVRALNQPRLQSKMVEQALITVPTKPPQSAPFRPGDRPMQDGGIV